MSVSHPILSRLQAGQPVLLSGDPAASLRAHGVSLEGPAALGKLVREDPAAVTEHYHLEITAGVEVLVALTADTIARALEHVGMAFRSAALTGTAVELALEAAELTPRPVVVAGVLGSAEVEAQVVDRIGEELGTHAARLATAGCQLILVRGFSRRGDAGLTRAARRTALQRAVATGLPAWAVIPVEHSGLTPEDDTADDAARKAFEGGAQLVWLEVPSVDVGIVALDRVVGLGRPVGLSLAAGPSEGPDAWARSAKRLLDAGAQGIGGGPGAGSGHLAVLSGLLRETIRESRWPRAV